MYLSTAKLYTQMPSLTTNHFLLSHSHTFSISLTLHLTHIHNPQTHSLSFSLSLSLSLLLEKIIYILKLVKILSQTETMNSRSNPKQLFGTKIHSCFYHSLSLPLSPLSVFLSLALPSIKFNNSYTYILQEGTQYYEARDRVM